MIWLMAGIGAGIIAILYLWLKNETLRRDLVQFRKQLQGSQQEMDQLLQDNHMLALELQRTLQVQLPDNAPQFAQFLLEKLPDVITEGQRNRIGPMELLKRHETRQQSAMTVAELQKQLQQLNNNLVSLLGNNTLHHYIELCRLVVEQFAGQKKGKAA